MSGINASDVEWRKGRGGGGGGGGFIMVELPELCCFCIERGVGGGSRESWKRKIRRSILLP